MGKGKLKEPLASRGLAGHSRVAAARAVSGRPRPHVAGLGEGQQPHALAVAPALPPPRGRRAAHPLPEAQTTRGRR